MCLMDLTAYIQMVAVLGANWPGIQNWCLLIMKIDQSLPICANLPMFCLVQIFWVPAYRHVHIFPSFLLPLHLSWAISSSTVKKEESGDPAQIHDKPAITTTRLELWSYYLYYVGNNGLSGFNFGPSQFQNLLFLAGYDPSNEPFTTPCGTGSCVLPYLGRVRDSEYSISPNNLNWTKPNSPNL